MKRGPKTPTEAQNSMASGPIPEPPAWLGEVAAAHFREVAAELAHSRGLRPTDGALIAAYAQAMARMIEAEASIDRDGAEYEARNGIVCSRPAVARAADCCNRANKLAVTLGLGASNRKRAGLKVGEEPEEVDPTASFVRET